MRLNYGVVVMLNEDVYVYNTLYAQMYNSCNKVTMARGFEVYTSEF